MKTLQLVPLLIACCLAAPQGARAQDAANRLQDDAADRLQNNATNRLSFSARFGFNIKARFQGLASLPAPSNSRTTPHGDAYNYDDGYVLPDISGSGDGQTWYWGYDDSSRQVNAANNTILMSKSVLASAAPDAKADDQPNYGFELAYQRYLGTTGRLRYGVEMAGNYLNLSLKDDSSLPADVVQTIYPFTYTPGTTPPAATPAMPYQGSFEGPGFVISANAGNPTTSLVTGGATVAGHREFTGDLWGLRLGPCLDWPLGERWDIGLGAGLAGGWLHARASWNETAIVSGIPGPTVSGGGNDDKFQWGYYVGANLSWQIAKHWSAVVGGQFQDLGHYHHSFSGREVELDLSQSFFVTAGLTWDF